MHDLPAAAEETPVCTITGKPPAKEPIAIVGIGCRFPGGVTGPRSFWKLLCDGVDAITEIPADRWNIARYFDPEPGKPGKSYVKWGGFVDEISRFDAAFFRITPREAASMDPQQRLLLEAAWNALEDGGQVVDLAGDGSDTGVFVGISGTDYITLQSSPAEKTSIDVHTIIGGVLSIAANRISYCFNFHGPSMAVDTACSSSLVAIHLACRSLLNRECSLALAGGVNALLTPDLCIVGSAKTNIGHMESAAGVAGVIKTALALKHRRIPKNLHFEQPNPQIDFQKLKLRVPTALETFPNGSGPRLAGVNSFGIGGTNAHAVLEEPPPETVRPAVIESDAVHHVWPLS